MSGDRRLDLICIGRTCVDLYAEQEGARLEDVQSFRKYVGGSAANIAFGTARLGVRSAMLTRVGEEPLGRYVKGALEENGVDVSRVRLDPGHLTPYVLLAVRETEGFPRLFAYGEAADMALSEEDVEPEFIASAKALLVTGTPLSRPRPREATFEAIRAAREAGTSIVFDLDYRPVFWGVVPREKGGEMFAESEQVTGEYRAVLPECDLIVGTEEEIRIAGGSTDTLEALKSIREISGAAIVLKVGAMGAVVFPEEIPGNIEEGLRVPGFPVEVFNSVGAGDAFMSGFLSGWLRGEPLKECLRLGNACGAIVVSRHGCSPAMPTREELEYFLALEKKPRNLREDRWLEHLHRATTRRTPEELHVLAIDHRWQLEEIADELGVERGRLQKLKVLLGWAFRRVAQGDPAAGVLLDDVYGGEALEGLTGGGFWIARAAEVAGSRPVELVGGTNFAAVLRTWPQEHVVKCNLYMHPDDEQKMKEIQEGRILQLYEACVANERLLLLEVQAPRGTGYGEGDLAALLERFYTLGVYPDWWKLPPASDPGVWKSIGEAVREHDPHCAGILVLGQGLPEAELAESFAAAASEPLCRGFAIGRSIYGGSARRWLAGEIGDEELVSEVAAGYERVISLWKEARRPGVKR
ncbi:5-dehydro-2-deoxygluconokinase [Rubrobacter xylanophilus]|uniref:5-dehydro-2-deoxygluconokinase n=1 Tax=Rubrobacter xylanophilus TaxID=49319 RepID=A0A510HGU4_9ACTN|nr:5-dehydro-2-deoxygluconokinase [Rubrobacter xylanophilus]BBL79212.1 5-dehydro-2-deoxygluconokinase [Rubrobacter xylanophilus]